MIGTITRTLPTLVAAAGTVALYLAGAAHADTEPFDGKYTLQVVNPNGTAGTSLWNVSSSCATEGCTASIQSDQGWSDIATLRYGSWEMSHFGVDSAQCSDGRRYSTTWEYSIDADTLTGTVSYLYSGQCGSDASGRKELPISLTARG